MKALRALLYLAGFLGRASLSFLRMWLTLRVRARLRARRFESAFLRAASGLPEDLAREMAREYSESVMDLLSVFSRIRPVLGSARPPRRRAL